MVDNRKFAESVHGVGNGLCSFERVDVELLAGGVDIDRFRRMDVGVVGVGVGVGVGNLLADKGERHSPVVGAYGGSDSWVYDLSRECGGNSRHDDEKKISLHIADVDAVKLFFGCKHGVPTREERRFL